VLVRKRKNGWDFVGEGKGDREIPEMRGRRLGCILCWCRGKSLLRLP
jgi:hypothetical protein